MLTTLYYQHHILIYCLSCCIRHMSLSCSPLCLQLLEYYSPHSWCSVSTCGMNEWLHGSLPVLLSWHLRDFWSAVLPLSLLWFSHNLWGQFHFWNGFHFHHIYVPGPHSPSVLEPLSSLLNHGLPCLLPTMHTPATIILLKHDSVLRASPTRRLGTLSRLNKYFMND